MTNEKIRCAPQNFEHFEETCKSCDCEIVAKQANRFGVIAYVVEHKTKKGLEEFKTKLKKK